MRISKQARRDAKGLYRACLAEGLLDEERVRRAVTRVLKAQPRGYLAILHHFQRLVKLDLDRRTARVESAIDLPAASQTELNTNLGRLYGAGLATQLRTNPDLVAGMRVRIGSDVYDGSVQGRLEQLKESF